MRRMFKIDLSPAKFLQEWVCPSPRKGDILLAVQPDEGTLHHRGLIFWRLQYYTIGRNKSPRGVGD